MITLEFKKWTEDVDSGLKDIVLNFLKDKLHLRDTESILNMPLSSMDQSIVGDLMNRGFFAQADDSLQLAVKNGSLTVQDLIDRLGGKSPMKRLTFTKPSLEV